MKIQITYTNENKTYYNEEDFYTTRTFYQDFDYETLRDHNYFPIQSVLFKRSLFLEKGGFDESLVYLEDWNLWLRYAFDNKFVYVPKTTSLYRVPSDAKISQQRQELLCSAYYEAKNKAIDSIKVYKQ